MANKKEILNKIKEIKACEKLAVGIVSKCRKGLKQLEKELKKI
jgi:hypothetical protein